MDPIELRVKNHAHVNPETGLPWSSNALFDCYRQGADQAQLILWLASDTLMWRSFTKLTATLDARFLRNVGSYALYVVNPGPDGNVSTAGYFLVNFKD